MNPPHTPPEPAAAPEPDPAEVRRLEAIGTLAGSVAHDLNNVLTVILGNVGVIRATRPADATIAPGLAEIETACRRAADLSRQLTAYAGTGRVLSDAVDLNRLAREAVAAAAPDRPVVIGYDLADPPPLVAGDPYQFRQAVVNVLRNAVEASPDGGRVVLRTAALAVAPGDAAGGYTPPPAPGAYGTFDVTDHGAGMDAAGRARVFDPFYSTKGTGRGLGMAAVLGVVRSHRGAVRVDSIPGRGTTVRLLLPAARAAAAPRWSEPTLESLATRHTGRLALVVDDEPNIRELVALLLEEAGYTVAAAGDGPGGLTQFQADPARFALAVVDVMLPGMNGAEVVRELRATRPDLPVVLITGYTPQELPEELLRQPSTRLLMKPFRLEQLQDAIRMAVGGSAEIGPGASGERPWA